MSILFYEVQRSGKMPDNKRIPWRFDSEMDDKGEDGEDLTGGWYVYIDTHRHRHRDTGTDT